MARSARRVDDDVRIEKARFLGRETERFQEARDVLLVRRGVRIARSRQARQLGFRVFRARQKSAVPDVVRLQRPPESLPDERRHARHQRRRDDRFQQLLDARFGHLAVELEAAVDLRRRQWRVGVGPAGSAEIGNENRVARVRLAIARRDRLRRAVSLNLHLVGLDLLRGRGGDAARVDEPVEARIVDHRSRDRLRHDLLHDRRDQPLAREPERRIRFPVFRLDLVAQVPVAEEAHALGKQALPIARQRMVEPQIVSRDIDLGIGRSLGPGLQRLGARAQRESPGQPHRGPLLARPLRALRQHLVQRRQREVQEGDERQLRLEEILGGVRRQIDLGELLVDGKQPPEVHVRVPPQLALEVDEVPVHLLERFLEAAQQRGELARVGLEPLLGEGAPRPIVAVLRAPHRSDLPEALLDPRALRLAVLAHEQIDQLAVVRALRPTRERPRPELTIAGLRCAAARVGRFGCIRWFHRGAGEEEQGGERSRHGGGLVA